MFMPIAIVVLGFLLTVSPVHKIYGENMKDVVVVLETNQGDITLKLMPQAAPKACENFIGLVKKGYYNGIIFHRVIKGFMIQGGDPTGTGRGGDSIWGKPFEDETRSDVKFDRKGYFGYG